MFSISRAWRSLSEQFDRCCGLETAAHENGTF